MTKYKIVDHIGNIVVHLYNLEKSKLNKNWKFSNPSTHFLELTQVLVKIRTVQASLFLLYVLQLSLALFNIFDWLLQHLAE